MSVEGFYRIEILVPGWVGTGMTVLDSQNIYGGDSAFMWRGIYRVQNGTIAAAVEVRQYAASPSGNIFGTMDGAYRSDITGTLPQGPFMPGMHISGVVASDIPGTATLPIKIVKVCDLP